MRRHIYILVGLSLFLTIQFAGCASSKPAAGYHSTVPDEIEKLIEKEYSQSIYSVGSDEAEKEDVAIRKAEMQARASIAREFKSQIDQLQKIYEGSVNDKSIEEYSTVIENFSTIKLEHAKVVKSMVKEISGGMVSAKVLVVISAAQLKESIENRLGEYTSFKASKAYSELEERVAAEQ